MMQRMKLYEQPTLIVLTLAEDVVTSSSTEVERDYDKGEYDIFVPAGSINGGEDYDEESEKVYIFSIGVFSDGVLGWRRWGIGYVC